MRLMTPSPPPPRKTTWISDPLHRHILQTKAPWETGAFLSPMSHIQQAKEFRKVFGHQNVPGREKRFPADLENKLRMQLSLIKEEGNEFNEALEEWLSISKVSTEEAATFAKKHVLKELADLAYVCYQMAVFLGVDLDVALDRVHQSNMSKLGEDGKPIYREDGKVLKGPFYKEPHLGDLV
jgi:predicted HAD superfamily Cof-like phosphohydrolase